MKEVAMELEEIRAMEKHSLGRTNVSEEEIEYFLKMSSLTQIVDNGEGSITTRFYSLQN